MKNDASKTMSRWVGGLKMNKTGMMSFYGWPPMISFKRDILIYIMLYVNSTCHCFATFVLILIWPDMACQVWTLKIDTATWPFLSLSDRRHGTFLKSTWRHAVFLKSTG